MTLAWDGSSGLGYHWAVAGCQGPWGTGVGNHYFEFQFGCLSTAPASVGTSLLVSGWLTAHAGCSGPADGTGGGNATDLADYTCSPFCLHWTTTSTGGTTFPWTDIFVTDGDGSSGCLCRQTIQVNGCNGSALPGASVTIAGVSGTTDATGKVTLTWPGSCTANLTVSCSRFGTYGPTSTAFVSGGTTTVNLTAASGFACASCSTIPLATTLHLTDSVYGSTTLTYSSGNWVSSTTAWSFPGDGCCGAASFGMIYTFTGSTCQLSSTYGHGPPVVGVPECPSGTGRQTAIPIGSTSLSGNPTSCGGTGWSFSATVPATTCSTVSTDIYIYPSGATYTLTE